ncbi:MAG: GTP-binding protein [Candidatus Lokiarchaeota archaeon]|nr:GTP-binding protein [Candidatus Lokiarchaeota archaeon]
MGLFDIFKRKSNHKAIFVGLDNSGKSTIISFLQEGKFVEHTPTMGKKNVDMEIGGTRMSLFDMGGQQDFRGLWLGELKNAKVVTFVIDAAAPQRFAEAKKELETLLPAIKEQKIHLLILANKHDIPGAVSLSKIITEFKLFDVDNFEIMEISAKTGYGMADAFAKFYTLLTGEKVKKNVLAKAISVFDKGGTPIVTTYNRNEIERVAIEGGFLVAITQFSKMKMNEDEESIITFESEKNGTFIVAKSKNLIGSVLWTADLGVPLEQSKSALKELLSHLETNASCSDTNSIAFHVEHYCTNII